MKSKVAVIVTDLDNTLYDWLGVWYACFSTMLNKIVNISGVAVDVLEKEFRQVHQKHGTSEYAFSIQELPSLRHKHGAEANLQEIYRSAIDAYRTTRREALRPYPDVVETLETLKDKGCLVIAYTESMAFYTKERVRRLGLDRVIDYLYSPPDHELPKGTTVEAVRYYPQEHYALRRTIQRETPRGEYKPNPALLLDILKATGATPEQTVYIGDSLMKDVAMAQQAGVLDVWAKYGASQSRPEYELLRRVSHWTEADVQRETELLKSVSVTPMHVLEKSYAELLHHIEPVKFAGGCEHLKVVADVWKKAVDVQQHFNDLGLRIRSYAMTLLTAVLGLAAYALKERVSVKCLVFNTSLATTILVAGMFAWVGFYLMDRHWYHRLLLGAVKHARWIEAKYAREIPEMSLTEAIGKESPTKVWRMTVHSSCKMNVFYGFVLGCLFLLAAVLHFAAPGATQNGHVGTGNTNIVGKVLPVIPTVLTPSNAPPAAASITNSP